jgi:hypothetical protein
MTHSNHRRGSRESLMGDWIVFTSGAGRIKDRAKHRKQIEILMKHNPVGLSTSTMDDGSSRRLRYVKGWDRSKDRGIHKGYSLEEINDHKDLSAGSAVYTNFEDAKAVLKELKEADLGFSIVYAGIFDKVFEACKQADQGPHTVNLSAETFGKVERLPEPKILEITTMCGHHMVSQYLVKYLCGQVKRGKMTAQDAAVEMAKQCTCNFFNVAMAEQLINEYNKAA